MADAGKDVSSNERAPDWVVLALLTVVGACLRFYDLAGDSLWYDEAASWRQASDGFVELWVRTARDNYPPLHNLLLYVSIAFFGDGEWALRMPSAVLGTASIPAFYWLGTIAGGRATGLLAAALLTFSRLHVEYSREGRMYALMVFAVILFAATSLRALRSPTRPRCLWVAIAGTALLYSHPFGTFDWLAVTAALALLTPWSKLSKSEIRRFVGSYAACAIAFLPWALILLGRAQTLQRNGFWIAPPTPSGVWRSIVSLLGGGWLDVVLLVGFALAIFTAWRGTDRGDGNRPLGPRGVVLLASSWAVVPIVISVGLSLITTPIFITRYIIGSLPAFLLLGSYGLAQLAYGRLLTTVLVGGILAAASTVLWQSHPYSARKSDWRSAAASLSDSLRPEDCVLIVPPFNQVAFEYYHRQRRCYVQLPPRRAPQRLRVPSRRVIAILNDPSRRQAETLLEELERLKFSPGERSLFHHLEVITFTLPADVPTPQRQTRGRYRGSDFYPDVWADF